MAYYSYHPYYSGSDYGEYNFNSYAVNSDYAQVPNFMSYNGYDYDKLYYNNRYDPNTSLYFPPNYPAHSYQTISYSATTYSGPKSFEFDPNYGMTQLMISYSKVEEEFNEPEYDEYDPTPYGGGYDIAETYGKALPPSGEICYPPIKSTSSISPPFDAVPSGSIVPLPLPTVEEEEEEIIEKPIITQNEKEGPVPHDSTIDKKRVKKEDNNSDTLDLDEPNEGKESEKSHHEDDYYSGSGHGKGYSGEQYHDYEKQVLPQYPSGYGLEAMDLCESLFGYWPCLSRMKRKEQHCCEEFSLRGNYCHENMWKGTAEYLFGNPNPYGGPGGGRGEDHGGELVYGYESHYPTQSQYRHIEYNDHDGSW